MATRAVAAAVTVALAASAPTDCTFAATYPRQYVAYAASPGSPPVLDGKLDEPFWLDVPFSTDFGDISTPAIPGKRTNVKMRYDDSYLYVGGLLQEDAIWANISTTCHCVNASQDQVVYHDDDFEVFVDADGSTHGYKETEVNAAAATWDLLLNKPYDDGGGENSSRVFGAAGFDMFLPAPGHADWPIAVAAAHVTGTLNDATTPHTFWSVELALPLARLVYNTTALLPVVGDFWRINFSRVEWSVKVVGARYWLEPSCTTCPVPGTATEDNWSWSPQGAIAMHLPERWGILQFADARVNATAPARYTQWPARSVASALFYAQRAYAGANNGSYAATAAALLPYTPDPNVLNGTCSMGPPSIALAPDARSYAATVRDVAGLWVATIRDDRYTLVTAA